MAKVKGQLITKKYAIYNDDCVEVLKDIDSNVVGFSIFSPPFFDLYAYSDSDEDFGNCKSYEEFFVQFGFLLEQLQRVMMPGRVVAVHCIDLPTFKSKVGFMAVTDFPGDIIRLFQKYDFLYHCPRITIWKDPLVAATRTKALGLAHKQIVKDSSWCRAGFPDFVLAFRKKGDNPKLISHPKGLLEYAGTRPVPRHLQRFAGWEDPKTNKRSHWIWQQYASPVWDDIDQTHVLPFRKGRDSDDQRHICPPTTTNYRKMPNALVCSR